MRLFPLFARLLPAAPVAFAQNAPKSAAKADGPAALVGSRDYVARPDDLVAEGGRLAFAFDQPGMGRIEIEGTVTGGTFEGPPVPEGQEALPFTACLQTDASE